MSFILTKELGRLVKWLRIFGFDAEYFNQDNLSSLILQALRDQRIIITRNQRLSNRPGLKILSIKSENLREQIKEVLKTLNLEPDKAIMFSRCTICNTALKPIEKDRVKDKVPEYVFTTQDSFTICSKCGRVYWQGTHWGNVVAMLKKVALENR